MSQNMTDERRDRIAKAVELATELIQWCETVKGFHPFYEHLSEGQMEELLAEFMADRERGGAS